MFDNENEKDLFEERAAIMEYDGCLSREQAENEAFVDVIKTRNNPSLLYGVNKPDNNAMAIQQNKFEKSVIYGGCYD